MAQKERPLFVRASLHAVNILMSVALCYGVLWAYACMLWPLPLHLRWFMVLPVAVVLGSGMYWYWLYYVCHACEHYKRSGERRPRETLDELGRCRWCGAYWVNDLFELMAICRKCEGGSPLAGDGNGDDAARGQTWRK